MVDGGNVTYVCKTCGKKFVGWKSAERIYCGIDCARPAYAAASITHGGSRTQLYSRWRDMKARCLVPTNAGFAYYGGRGISVCPQWRDDFKAFRDWAMANGYKHGLELDRRDNDKGYSPENCRWATRSQQMQNTRKRRDAKTSKYRGVSFRAANGRWIAQIRGMFLGSFVRERDAAIRYDRAAIEHFGEFAVLNFPAKQGRESCTNSKEI